MKWFGRRWNQKLCKPENKVHTPILLPCALCTRQIARGDQGVVLPAAGKIQIEEGKPPVAVVAWEPWHLDCLLGHVQPKGKA